MKIFEIERELAASREAYHEAVTGEGLSREQEAAASANIKELMAFLSATISAGAVSCPECGVAPHGMKRRAGLYEIGCLEHSEIRAQGETPEEAVANFNAVVDRIEVS